MPNFQKEAKKFPKNAKFSKKKKNQSYQMKFPQKQPKKAKKKTLNKNSQSSQRRKNGKNSQMKNLQRFLDLNIWRQKCNL